MRKEFRQRLATEYSYAATKMQEVEPVRKLFYFSVFFGEATRILNWEWDRDLALIHMVTQFVHTQINTAIQAPGLVQLFPVDWSMVYDKLTQVAFDLADYFKRTKSETSREELLQILERLAEIAYAVSGNGSYLYEKGLIKF